ncbi:MAG: 30S ribosomal protein S8e [Candidatus Woesearchaeota archaeon]
MAISHLRAKRKPSGGRYKKITKKLRHKGNLPTLTHIGEPRITKLRTRGNNPKVRLLTTNLANVYDPKSKKYFKSKIESVIESPSNRNFVRRNILTKGTVIKTEKGNAKVTSRPGQEKTVNAILV